MTNEQFKLDSNRTISKSVELASTPIQIEGLSRGLDLRQQRFFNMAILTVNESGISEFGEAEYSSIFKEVGDNFYSKKIREDIQSLGTLGILESDPTRERWRNLFIDVEYNKNINKFRFEWSPKMLEHVLKFKNTYIQQDLKVLANFNNKYSYIWYDYFKSGRRKWKWVLSKEDIIKQLRLQDKKSYLRNHSMFYQQCIDAPLKELNEYTEYTIECTIIRNGKKIEAYEFRRYTNADVIKSVSNKQLTVLREISERYGDKHYILAEIEKYAVNNRELADKLLALYPDLASYKNLVENHEPFNAEDLSKIIKLAIAKDNTFKKWLNQLEKGQYQPSFFEAEEEIESEIEAEIEGNYKNVKMAFITG